MDCEVVIETEVDDNYDTPDKNNAPKRKSVRKRSDMWNYFTPINGFVATCNMCGLDFSYRTSTTNLRKHVLCKHFGGNVKNEKIVGALEMQNTSKEKRENNNTSNISINSTRELHNYTKRTRTDPVKRQSVVEMSDPQPMSSHKSWRGDERRESDMYDAYAFTIAAKLRKLEERQRLYAERIINEALFKGAIEQLSPLSEIVICIGSGSDS